MNLENPELLPIQRNECVVVDIGGRFDIIQRFRTCSAILLPVVNANISHENLYLLNTLTSECPFVQIYVNVSYL